MNKDLIVLVPDSQMNQTVQGLLARPEALMIRPLSKKIVTHIGRDPGALRTAHDFLRSMANQYAHALVMIDLHGCGKKDKPRPDLEQELEQRLSNNGWGERAAAVVLDPELESWVWSPSPEVDRCLGWQGKNPGLRRWLAGQGLWDESLPKPPDPKTAMETALREVRKSRSASIFRELADSVSFKHCQDPSFNKFLLILRGWFPVRGPEPDMK